MDFTAIWLSVFQQRWFLIPLLLLVAVATSSWFKGVFGEWMVNLAARLDKNNYHLIKNTTLPTEDGTTQIDHIIVAETGVFVVANIKIERKKYVQNDITHHRNIFDFCMFDYSKCRTS